MISGVRLKICGLTSVADAAVAAEVGADYLGFIFHPTSPRFLPLEAYRAMAPDLPKVKRVAVSVAPTVETLTRYREAGFDYFQVHFPVETSPDVVASWTSVVGPERLWLAPRLAPGAEVDPAWPALARTILFDTYQPAAFGGSGRPSDWAGFRRLRQAHPEFHWILAGGLGPDNAVAALAATGAEAIDMSSGVERAPGFKDPAKLRALAAAMGSVLDKTEL